MKAAIVVILLAAVGCFAQQPQATPSSSAATSQAASEKPNIMIPPGTEILLSFVRPVSTRTTRPGDEVYLQTSAPVVVDGNLAIPAGTFLQGKLDGKVRAQFSRHRAVIHLKHAVLTYSNGYMVKMPGIVELTTNLEESTSTYGETGVAAPIAAAAGSAGGFGIGAAAGGVKGAAIGGIAGGVIGLVAALALAAHHGGVFMDIGTPSNAVLNAPVWVNEDRVQAAAHTYAPSAPRPAPRHMCYDPGTPGTPDTVIPGTPATPGTPPTVIPGGPGQAPTVIPGTPGTPGTPDTVIPGTPGTPGHSYPCPPG